MNRQDAKNAKKETGEKKEERELSCWKPVLRSIFSFSSLFLGVLGVLAVHFV